MAPLELLTCTVQAASPPGVIESARRVTVGMFNAATGTVKLNVAVVVCPTESVAVALSVCAPLVSTNVAGFTVAV